MSATPSLVPPRAPTLEVSASLSARQYPISIFLPDFITGPLWIRLLSFRIATRELFSCCGLGCLILSLWPVPSCNGLFCLEDFSPLPSYSVTRNQYLYAFSPLSPPSHVSERDRPLLGLVVSIPLTWILPPSPTVSSFTPLFPTDHGLPSLSPWSET